MSKKTTYSVNNIQALDWKDHIRKRAGMYIGSVDARGFIGTLKNILSNSFSITKADYFQMELKEDCSANFIFKNIQQPLLDSWATDSINSRYATYYLSLPTLNALSSKFNITFFDEKGNQIAEQKFQKGKLNKGKVEKKELNCHSLEIDFKLDKEIWTKDLEWNINYIIHQIKDFAYLHKNVIFEIKYKLNKKPCRIIYHFKNGLKNRIEIERINGLLESKFPIYLEKDFDTISMELAFAFCDYHVDAPFLKSYVNDLLTHQGGTHEKGLINAIRIALKKYIKEKYPDKKYNFSKKKIITHLIAALNLRIENPVYEGCTRNKLGSPEVVNLISNFVSEVLLEQLKSKEDSAEYLLRNFEIYKKVY